MFATNMQRVFSDSCALVVAERHHHFLTSVASGQGTHRIYSVDGLCCKFGRRRLVACLKTELTLSAASIQEYATPQPFSQLSLAVHRTMVVRALRSYRLRCLAYFLMIRSIRSRWFLISSYSSVRKTEWNHGTGAFQHRVDGTLRGTIFV